MEKWRRQRAYEDRLSQISCSVENQILGLRASYNEYRRGEEAALQKQVARTTQRLEKIFFSWLKCALRNQMLEERFVRE